MKVMLFSDGSARGNPEGPGGFGTVLQVIDSKGELHEKELSAGYDKTTNNRMELMGVIRGLEELNRPCQVEVVSDSKYVISAFNEKWIDSWIKKGWKKSDGKPVKNVELWKRLLEAAGVHDITWTWVKGHDGHPENERCDILATTAADGPSDELLHDDGGDLR
ncbi:MAG: ribonuclease HI [Butyrivibrio sp.]|nr:ribonuclease HI [Butyrivibrio sp.]